MSEPAKARRSRQKKIFARLLAEKDALEARASQAEKDLASALALVGEKDRALDGICNGYGGAGGEDEGESWEETVEAMRADALKAFELDSQAQALARLENRVKAEVWEEAAKMATQENEFCLPVYVPLILQEMMKAKAAALREGK